MSSKSKDARTREPQYERLLELERGLESLRLMTSQAWHDDPKRLAFTLARYKFVAKMLEGAERMLEVGCGDAFGTRIVVQAVKSLTAIDFDPIFVEDVNARMDEPWRFACHVHDMLAGPFPGEASLAPHGVLILGMPSLESQPHASPLSKAGHVNCKSMPDFRHVVQRYCHNVFMFSMNDEVVHTGFHKMAHYLFAVGCGNRAKLP